MRNGTALHGAAAISTEKKTGEKKNSERWSLTEIFIMSEYQHYG